MEEICEIDASDTDIREYLVEMYMKTDKDNSVTGKITGVKDVRIVMFIEEKVRRPFGAD